MKRMWSIKQLKEFIKSTTKDISTLVDKDGHERFIEGDITLEEITGVSKTYGKWSLSGSHLLIVLSIAVADTTVLANGVKFCDISIPKWIYDKVAVIWGADAVIRQSITLYADNWSTQTMNTLLSKANDVLTIYGLNDLTLTADRKTRIAFDLLIDND